MSIALVSLFILKLEIKGSFTKSQSKDLAIGNFLKALLFSNDQKRNLFTTFWNFGIMIHPTSIVKKINFQAVL